MGTWCLVCHWVGSTKRRDKILQTNTYLLETYPCTKFALNPPISPEHRARRTTLFNPPSSKPASSSQQPAIPASSQPAQPACQPSQSASPASLASPDAPSTIILTGPVFATLTTITFCPAGMPAQPAHPAQHHQPTSLPAQPAWPAQMPRAPSF